MAIPNNPGIGFGPREVRQDDHYPWRFWVSPFGALDFIDLPAAIRQMRRKPHSDPVVEFSCDDGFIYELSGDPTNGSPYRTWTISKVRQVEPWP